MHCSSKFFGMCIGNKSSVQSSELQSEAAFLTGSFHEKLTRRAKKPYRWLQHSLFIEASDRFERLNLPKYNVL